MKTCNSQGAAAQISITVKVTESRILASVSTWQHDWPIEHLQKKNLSQASHSLCDHLAINDYSLTACLTCMYPAACAVTSECKAMGMHQCRTPQS